MHYFGATLNLLPPFPECCHISLIEALFSKAKSNKTKQTKQKKGERESLAH